MWIYKIVKEKSRLQAYQWDEDDEVLRLDKEDIGFLEEEILDAEENGFENANVVIESVSAVTIENIVENTESEVK